MLKKHDPAYLKKYDVSSLRHLFLAGEPLDEPTARAVIERLLHGAIDLLTGEGNPRGCLLVQGALTCGETGEDARQELIERRAAAQSAIRKRFESARAERDLSANLEPADLARYVSTVLEGMAVEAAGGASRAQLERVAEITLRASQIVQGRNEHPLIARFFA